LINTRTPSSFTPPFILIFHLLSLSFSGRFHFTTSVHSADLFRTQTRTRDFHSSIWLSFSLSFLVNFSFILVSLWHLLVPRTMSSRRGRSYCVARSALMARSETRNSDVSARVYILKLIIHSARM
jgi:hypothetical protein